MPSKEAIMRQQWRNLALVASIMATPAWALDIGVLGDSISDEYLGVGHPVGLTDGITDFAAKNWVQILAQTRGGYLNFGALEMDDSVRGEPQNRGYAYNWARAGATATTPGILGSISGGLLPDFAPLANQTQGLLPSVQSGAVKTIFAGIGSNDYLVRNGVYGVIPAQPLSGPAFDAWESGLIDAIFAPLDALHAAGAQTILVGLIPGTADSGANPSTELRDAIAHTNGLIEQAAQARGFTAVDWFAWSRERDANGDIVVGGLAIHPDGATQEDLVPAGTPGAGPCNSEGMCAAPSHATHAFTEDGIHPNTIPQGLIANEILKALNAANGTAIPLLTTDELFRFAGIEVPVPAAAWLFGSALIGLGATRMRRAA
jgi:phospholipase/lecithinase/hemolysin